MLLFSGRPGICESEGDVVQGRSKVVSDLAYQDCILKGEGINPVKLGDKPPLLVLLKRNGVEVAFDESVSNCIQRVGTGARPTNLPTHLI